LSSEAESKEMKVICTLITWLDGYANLSCVDPLKIERATKLCREDVQGTWARIKGDVRTIGKLPSESERVVRLAKIVILSRFLFFGFLVLSVIIVLFASLISPTFFSNPTYGLVALVVIAVVLNADVFTYVYSARNLSLAVKEFFDAKKDRATMERRRIRDAVQVLIDKLASRIRSAGGEPADYRFGLLDASYANIRVTKEKGRITATVNLGTG